jgi:membrane protein DedA with SNARE-associated domain
MLNRLTDALAGLVVATISGGGYAGVIALMAIESACIPLPSEVIMPFSGYLVSTGRFNLAAVATAGAIGCNIGSTIAYWVGAHGGRPLVERWGHYAFVGRRELAIADRFFARYGGITVFLARLLPVIRTFIALPAGIARMNPIKFQLYTFLGSWPWCFGLAWLGMTLGNRWNADPRMKEIFHRFDGAIVVLVLAAAAWYLWTHAKHRVGARD